MKRLFLYIASVVCSISMYAAIPTMTASFKILVKSNSSISGDQLIMAESAAWSDANDNGYDGTKYPYPGNLQLWVPATFANLATVATNNLENTPITVQTIGDTEYKFTFSNVTGRALYFWDKTDNQLTLISNSNSYTVVLPVNSVIANRFYIVVEPFFTVTTNVNGWATYSNSLDLVAEAAPAGVTEPIIYSAQYDGAETLTLTAQDGVKANTGVVVWGDPLTTYTLVPGTVTDYTSDLTASVTETTVDATKTNYCLATINGVSAFYEYTGAKVSANKAYLEVGGTAAPKRIRMVVNGTTDVENVEAEVTTEKVYQNGQLLIKKGDQLYNLQGQIVK